MENTNAARLRSTMEGTSAGAHQPTADGSNLSFTGRVSVNKEKDEFIRDISLKTVRGRVLKTVKALVAGIRRSVGMVAVNRKPDAPSLLPFDWYKRKLTAQEQGEFWVHTLLGR